MQIDAGIFVSLLFYCYIEPCQVVVLTYRYSYVVIFTLLLFDTVTQQITYLNCCLPHADDSEVSDIPAVSNVRQDLTEWQEKHAKLVLATVKVYTPFSSKYPWSWQLSKR